MKSILFGLILFLTDVLFSQPGFIWAKQIGGGGGYDSGKAIDVDNNGNVYTTGHYGWTVDFDPGPGVYNQGWNGWEDVFISKLDANGNFIWAKTFGSSFIDEAYSIKIGRSGCVYTTGSFSDSCDFDPGPNTFYIKDRGTYIHKLSANGNFIWAKAFKPIGNGSVYSYNLFLDKLENVFVIGSFGGTIDFDPGPGIDSMSSSGTFLCKLDSAGNFLWSRHLSTRGEGYSISLDSLGNIYTVGNFTGISDFDPGISIYSLSASGWGDVFISKLNQAGNFIWAKQLTTPGYAVGHAIICDALGNSYFTGSFAGPLDCDPGPGTFTINSYGTTDDIFICKLDNNGNFSWAKNFGKSGTDEGRSIFLDKNNEIYTTGVFKDTIDFDSGPGTYTLFASQETAFVCQLDSTGGFKCATEIGNSSVYPNGIHVDKNLNIYMTGGFYGTVDFDPGAPTYYMSVPSSCSFCSSIFINKFSACGLSTTINDFYWDSDFNIYPNPSSGMFTINLQNTNRETKICVYDLLGNCIWNKDCQNNAKIDLSGQSKGIYFVDVLIDQERIVKKIVIN